VVINFTLSKSIKLHCYVYGRSGHSHILNFIWWTGWLTFQEIRWVPILWPYMQMFQLRFHTEVTLRNIVIFYLICVYSSVRLLVTVPIIQVKTTNLSSSMSDAFTRSNEIGQLTLHIHKLNLHRLNDLRFDNKTMGICFHGHKWFEITQTKFTQTKLHDTISNGNLFHGHAIPQSNSCSNLQYLYKYPP
jgi:hypothetical protein